MATSAVRRRREQTVIDLGANPRGSFMTGSAAGRRRDVITRFARSRSAVVATSAVRRRCEQTVIYLRASPGGGFMAGNAIGAGDNVVAWLS